MAMKQLSGLAKVVPTGVLLGSLSLVAVPATATTPRPDAVATSTLAHPSKASTDPIAHDPTMIKQGDYYYVFITGDSGAANTYLPMKRSKDLLHWQELGPVFTSPPKWIVDTLGTTPHDFWAPDITYFNGRYYLYYAASQFGGNNSVIALATNTTLDPASPDYRWVDQGLVLRSVIGDNFNAIDANVTLDKRGVPWLSYGSFWSGILMRQMDATTGKLSTNNTIYPLVDRKWAPNAVEGSSIVRHGDYYYLFASFDYCCRATDSEYRTVVGRSTDITGPYVDKSGQPMLNGGGTELLRSYNEFAGPGGGDAYVDGTRTLFVHHYYDVNDNGRPKLSVRTVQWSKDGWLSLSEPVSGSRSVGHGPAYFNLIEKNRGNAVGAVAGGPQAPLCGYEGDNIALLPPGNNPCLQWRMEYANDGYYAIRNRQSNKVFDTSFCGYADGTNIGQWGWLHNDCQQFRFLPGSDGWTKIQGKNAPSDQAGKLVDAGSTCDAGDNVQLWSADAQRCQQYRLQPVGDVLLVSASTGIAIGTGRSPSGQQANPPQEQWHFTHTDNGYYLVSNGQGHPLPVSGCQNDAAAGHSSSAMAHPCDWRLEPLNDGTFRLVDRTSGQVAAFADDYGRLQLQTWANTASQRFSVVLP